MKKKRITSIQWDYPYNGTNRRLGHRVRLPHGDIKRTTWDLMSKKYPDAEKMVLESWSTRRINDDAHASLKSDLVAIAAFPNYDLNSHIHRAIAKRLPEDQQKVITLLLERNAQRLYTDDITLSDAQLLLDEMNIEMVVGMVYGRTML